MEIIIDRPYTDYAKQIAVYCAEINEQHNFDAVIYYNGYLDGLNNQFVHTWFEQDPHKIKVVVTNDYLDVGSAHRLEIERLAQINTEFVIVTEADNAALDFDMPPNVRFVPMGPSLVAEPQYYGPVQPQRWKNLNQGPHWIFLSRNTRPHRMLVGCVLAQLGLGIDHDPRGLLKLNSRDMGASVELNTYEDWRPFLELFIKHKERYYQLGPIDHRPGLDQRVKIGWDILYQNRHTPQDFADIGGQYSSQLDNHSNFDLQLRKYYQTAVIEIVPETLYFTKAQLVSEKFTNSVMGFCLPIFLSNPGTVDYVRQLGFDVFDDVIDHSYDVVIDPVERAFAAVERNLRLFMDSNWARRQWIGCFDRLESNYLRIVRGTVKDWCVQRFKQHYVQAMNGVHVRRDLDI